MLKLSPVNNDCPGQKLWCGPAVLSSITGKPVSWCNAELAKRRADPALGVPWEFLRDVCAGFGIEFDMIYFFAYSAKLVLEYSRNHPEEWLLFVVDDGPGHYVIVENGWLVDSGNQIPRRIEETRFKDSIIRWGFRLLEYDNRD